MHFLLKPTKTLFVFIFILVQGVYGMDDSKGFNAAGWEGPYAKHLSRIAKSAHEDMKLMLKTRGTKLPTKRVRERKHPSKARTNEVIKARLKKLERIRFDSEASISSWLDEFIKLYELLKKSHSYSKKNRVKISKIMQTRFMDLQEEHVGPSILHKLGEFIWKVDPEIWQETLGKTFLPFIVTLAFEKSELQTNAAALLAIFIQFSTTGFWKATESRITYGEVLRKRLEGHYRDHPNLHYAYERLKGKFMEKIHSKTELKGQIERRLMSLERNQFEGKVSRTPASWWFKAAVEIYDLVKKSPYLDIKYKLRLINAVRCCLVNFQKRLSEGSIEGQTKAFQWLNVLLEMSEIEEDESNPTKGEDICAFFEDIVFSKNLNSNWFYLLDSAVSFVETHMSKDVEMIEQMKVLSIISEIIESLDPIIWQKVLAERLLPIMETLAFRKTALQTNASYLLVHFIDYSTPEFWKRASYYEFFLDRLKEHSNDHYNLSSAHKKLCSKRDNRLKLEEDDLFVMSYRLKQRFFK